MRRLLLILALASLGASPVMASAVHLERAAVERALRDLPPAAGPLALAAAVPVRLGLAEGRWQTLGDQARWTLTLSSPGATLLIVHFDRLRLPAGSQLWLQDARGGNRQGPYSAADLDPQGGLWAPVIPGEQLQIELAVPAAARDAVQLSIDRVDHGRLRFGQVRGETVPAKSGSCNIDVACPEAAAWADPIRASVHLQIPTLTGTLLCSGTLMNNSRQDGSPLILSADHCDINATNAASLRAYFNYQTSSCGGSPDGSLAQNLSGATLLARDSRSDFTLVRMNTPPPAAFNAFYAGYNASGSGSASGAGIHHPSGDEKRISFFNRPLRPRQANIDGRLVEAWEVVWARGVTEQGSSGSALFNGSRQVVGVLSGGLSSCANPAGEDYYGRLDVAWANGLRPHLDPAGTGNPVLGGRNPDGSGGDPGAPAGSGGGGGGGLGSLLPGLLAALIARRAWRGAARESAGPAAGR
ncbi:MAG TPA: trypsin-like serine protease [Nevskiaceae bacterium]|nr:trypsin-like serine protease [Nevskiaceae bacterium]